jgi:hypothetical protein
MGKVVTLTRSIAGNTCLMCLMADMIMFSARSENECQRSRISPGLRGCPSRNSPPRLSRNSPPWAVCLPGVGLAGRFALHPSTGGWKGARPIAVTVAWSICQRIIAAYSRPDRRRG